MPNNNTTTVPWNKGRLVGQKLPLKLKEIWAVRVQFQLSRNLRDLALFNLAIDSKLRGSDLVKIRVSDVSKSGAVACHAMVQHQKTGKPVQLEITEQSCDANSTWMNKAELSGSDFLLPSRIKSSLHLSTRQYARIVETWITDIAPDANNYGTDSLRRTKPTLIHKRTNNLRAVHLLLGHTKLESRVRYLGIEVDDALEIAEQTKMWCDNISSAPCLWGASRPQPDEVKNTNVEPILKR